MKRVKLFMAAVLMHMNGSKALTEILVASIFYFQVSPNQSCDLYRSVFSGVLFCQFKVFTQFQRFLSVTVLK